MPVNEPLLVPEVETCPDARNIAAVRLFDRRLVSIALYLDRIKDPITVVDEVHAIAGQRLWILKGAAWKRSTANLPERMICHHRKLAFDLAQLPSA
jgi:hypothetical protein